MPGQQRHPSTHAQQAAEDDRFLRRFAQLLGGLVAAVEAMGWEYVEEVKISFKAKDGFLHTISTTERVSVAEWRQAVAEMLQPPEGQS